MCGRVGTRARVRACILITIYLATWCLFFNEHPLFQGLHPPMRFVLEPDDILVVSFKRREIIVFTFQLNYNSQPFITKICVNLFSAPLLFILFVPVKCKFKR